MMMMIYNDDDYDDDETCWIKPPVLAELLQWPSLSAASPRPVVTTWTLQWPATTWDVQLFLWLLGSFFGRGILMGNSMRINYGS